MATATRDHIHMSTTLGSAPENAPDLKWSIHDRRKIPVIFLNLRWTKNGTLRRNILFEAGKPLQLFNYMYEIRCYDDGVRTAEEMLDDLYEMHGKVVYLCDTKHTEDGADHTADIRPMVLEIPEGEVTDHYGLEFFFIKIQLTDASTLT